MSVAGVRALSAQSVTVSVQRGRDRCDMRLVSGSDDILSFSLSRSARFPRAR